MLNNFPKKLELKEWVAQNLNFLISTAVAGFRMTTRHNYLQVHRHRFGLADDNVCPLCSNMDSAHLDIFPDLHHPLNDISLRYWKSRRQMAEKTQTGVD